jgi:hypothetical protein
MYRVSFESSFQVQPFGLRVCRRIIVFAKISAVALPIPLVAPVISAVLLMVYCCVEIILLDFIVIFLELQFVLNLRYIFTHAFCPDGKPIFFSRSNSTAFINDCILDLLFLQ